MKEIIKTKEGRVKVVTNNELPTKTQQHHKENCDINVIIARAKRGGGISHVNPHQGRYMDLTELPDYATALNTVIKANEAFNSLPAKVREEFQNDPKKLIQFLGDPKNIDRAIELGLVNKKPDPVQPPVQVDNGKKES